MKKFLIFIAAAFTLLLTPPIFAQTQQSAPAGDRPQIAPIVPPQDGNPLFGENHYYSVTFRGNGEAIVLFKTIFSNQKGTVLNTLTFRVPRVNPQDIAVYQLLRDPVCVRYRGGPIYEPAASSSFVRDPNCLEYRDPDYNDFLYGYGGKYQKAQSSLEGDTLTVTLPSTVGAEKTGAVLVYYRASGYAKRTAFGAYDFTFETLKVNSAVSSVQVGISVDADQILAGAQGKIEYRFSDLAAKSAELSTGAVASSVLDQYYQQIGQGQIVKSASNLQPLESYTVKGSFASSQLKLYGGLIAKTIGGIIVFVIALLLILRAVMRRFTSTASSSAKTSNTGGMLIGVVVGSFVLSLIVVGVTVGLVFLLNSLTTMAYGSTVIYPVVMLFIAIVAVCAYIFIVVVPAVILGVKKGTWWGVGLFGLTIMWLGLYLVAVLLILLLTNKSGYPQPYQGQPVRLMEDAKGAEPQIIEKESAE